jgi:predicted amidohydrolase YtcJ
LKAVGAGIAVRPWRYLSGANLGGPPLRMILDSGIHIGAGSDSAQISTLNPWNMIYSMVTGRNAAGLLVNDGQQITRAEAIRLYTVNNGWFFKEESRLGSIEEGKLGDVVVLNADYFDAAEVPKIHPVLTVIDGRWRTTRSGGRCPEKSVRCRPCGTAVALNSKERSCCNLRLSVSGR